MDHNNQIKKCTLHPDSVYRLLPPGLQQLQQLQGICYSKIREMIVRCCKKRLNDIFNFDKNKSTMKEHLAQLPVTVREEILEYLSVKEDKNENYPLQLYLLEVLFSTGVKELEWVRKGKWKQKHVEALLDLISMEGRDLRTLELAFKTSSFHPLSINSLYIDFSPTFYQKIGNILASAENLVSLELSDICDDTIMKLIGESCTRLQRLYITSSNITATGVHYLTQNFVRHPVETEEGKRVWESTLWGVAGIFPSLEELLPEGESVTFYERKKSPLCSTLKSLNIRDVHESKFKAVLAILELIPDLETLDEGATSVLIRELYKLKTTRDDFALHPLNLTSVDVEKIDDHILHMINSICPKLRRLKYWSRFQKGPSSFSLSVFNSFQYLESLNISYIVSFSRLFLGELSPAIRERLKEIELCESFSEVPMDVSSVHQCSAVRILYLSFTTILWDGSSNGGQLPAPKQLQNLSFVRLSCKVTAKAVLSILECAPNLEYFVLDDIIERNEDFVQRILSMRKMPRLETFQVYCGFLLDTEDELLSFLSHFDKLKHVGKIRFLSD